MQLHTDASGVGFGGLFIKSWFASAWPPKYLNDPKYSINFKELFAIVVAFEIWGYLFKRKQILFNTDNFIICNLWKSLAPKTPELMKLLRHLFFRAHKSQSNVLLSHVPGRFNIFADLLSRLQIEKFLQALPTADPQPTPIPALVWDI